MLRELKIRFPRLRRYECYECPGAFYIDWGRIWLEHRWEMKDGRVPRYVDDDSRLQVCRTCGRERTLSPNLTGLWAISVEDMLRFIGSPPTPSPVKHEWAEDDVWRMKHGH